MGEYNSSSYRTGRQSRERLGQSIRQAGSNRTGMQLRDGQRDIQAITQQAGTVHKTGRQLQDRQASTGQAT
jgi:hypothetical protein